jgi:uncharacterized membrane protein
MKRIYSIDFARGVVMIIMALDHVRDMIHTDSITQSPTNLATTTPALFFTRWITYLCAPTFVFLAGSSAYMSFRKSGNLSATRRFLLKRGLYLVLLEFIVVNLGLFFDLGYHTLIFEVIATIGFGFIVLAFLLHVHPKILALLGLLIIATHNLVPMASASENPLIKFVLIPLFSPGAFPIFSGRILIMAYPPIPWLGIMLTGFACGRFFEMAEAKRKSLFLKIGISALLLFVFVRFINSYGDLVPWSEQKNSVYSFLSFMNVAKYPPSLVFCLVTLGCMFILLWLGEGMKNKIASIASVYGKVPLFYFLVHFFLIHFIMLAIMFLQGFHWSQLDFASGTFGRPKGLQSGLSLGAVYLTWIGVVVVLYKPCKWYGNYKSTNRQWWLKYI